MLERDVEKYFVERVKLYGGEVRKLKWLGRAHAQDRFVALNGVWLVELKRPKEQERAGQKRERERLEAQGVRCRVINSLAGVDAFIEEVLT